MEMTYDSMFKEITPSLYDLESMFWVVVAKELYGKYGKKGEQAARTWMRRHANWRGAQIRKGHQALGVPCNVENLFVYTDNPVNNAFIHLWKKEHKWTPYNLKLTVSPGECVMCDRMLEHDCGLLAATFCDELHQSFTTTYHPDAVVSVPNTMTKGDPPVQVPMGAARRCQGARPPAPLSRRGSGQGLAVRYGGEHRQAGADPHAPLVRRPDLLSPRGAL